MLSDAARKRFLARSVRSLQDLAELGMVMRRDNWMHLTDDAGDHEVEMELAVLSGIEALTGVDGSIAG